MGFMTGIWARVVATSGRLMEINGAHTQSSLVVDIEREPELDKEQKRILQLSALGEYDDVRDYLQMQPETKKTALQKLLMDSVLEVPEIHKDPRALVETLRDTGFSFHNYMYRHVRKEDEYKLWALPMTHANDKGVEAAAMLVAERARERISMTGTYTPDFSGMYGDFTVSGREKYDDPGNFSRALIAVQNELVEQVGAAKGVHHEATAAGYLSTHTRDGMISAGQAKLWSEKASGWGHMAEIAAQEKAAFPGYVR